jgi:hypothetical protein
MFEWAKVFNALDHAATLCNLQLGEYLDVPLSKVLRNAQFTNDMAIG